MTTEQTGRQDIDSTDSQARIEPTTLVAAPPGGDPTPLPRRRAAHGTRTGMRAAPPPIPDGTRPKLAAAPARASSQVMPPPIPSKPAIEIAAHADGMMAAASKPASPLPDPDGWSLPATIEPSGPSYPSVYHPEPAAPDVTVPDRLCGSRGDRSDRRRAVGRVAREDQLGACRRGAARDRGQRAHRRRTRARRCSRGCSREGRGRRARPRRGGDRRARRGASRSQVRRARGGTQGRR